MNIPLILISRIVWLLALIVLRLHVLLELNARSFLDLSLLSFQYRLLYLILNRWSVSSDLWSIGLALNSLASKPYILMCDSKIHLSNVSILEWALWRYKRALISSVLMGKMRHWSRSHLSVVLLRKLLHLIIPLLLEFLTWRLISAEVAHNVASLNFGLSVHFIEIVNVPLEVILSQWVILENRRNSVYSSELIWMLFSLFLGLFRFCCESASISLAFLRSFHHNVHDRFFDLSLFILI